MSYLFFLYLSWCSSLQVVYDVVLSDKNEALSVKSPTNVFVFGDFNIYRRDKLTYYTGND